MPTKIRLQRHGKKRYAYFHVVIADSRAPRDGKFIEKIGTYNPNTNPATIDLNFDKALDWFKKGAQPTDTVRALLSYKGVIYKNHLDKGVLKGAFTQEEADKRFEEWLATKEGKINAKKDQLSATEEAEAKKRHAAEQEANKKKADAIAAKTADLAGEVAEAAQEVAEEAAEAVSDAAEAVADAVESAAEKVEEAVSNDNEEEKEKSAE
jgi:small subunit ribosomal protein S16